MLFYGYKTLKNNKVISEGEKKMCCILSKMMLEKANILYETTNHLDLETITYLNNTLISFKVTIFLTQEIMN